MTKEPHLKQGNLVLIALETLRISLSKIFNPARYCAYPDGDPFNIQEERENRYFIDGLEEIEKFYDLIKRTYNCLSPIQRRHYFKRLKELNFKNFEGGYNIDVDNEEAAKLILKDPHKYFADLKELRDKYQKAKGSERIILNEELYNLENYFAGEVLKYFEENRIFEQQKKLVRFASNEFQLLLNNLESDAIRQEEIEDAPPSAEKPQLELKDFFSSDLTIETINEIKNRFREYRGKKMAILIYLLQTVHEKIIIVNHSKTQSRQHFVRAFTGDKNIKMQGINKVFDSATNNLNILKTDADYIKIDQELNNLLIK